MAFLHSSLVTLSCSEMSWAKKKKKKKRSLEKLLSKSKKHFIFLNDETGWFNQFNVHCHFCKGYMGD